MISAQVVRRAVWRPLWQLPKRIDLIVSLTRRELAARYRGSVLGFLWTLVTPIVMIAIFTIIFAGFLIAGSGLQSTVWNRGAGGRHRALTTRDSRHFDLSAGYPDPPNYCDVGSRLAGGVAGGICQRYCAGHRAGLDGLDVSHADYLSRIDRPGKLPSHHKFQSLHPAHSELSALDPRRPRSRLVGAGLFPRLRGAAIPFWLLVVCPHTQELCRRDLMKLPGKLPDLLMFVNTKHR